MLKEEERIEVEILGYRRKETRGKHVGVYTLTHLQTNKQYHGSTTDIGRRKREHMEDLRSLTHANKNMREAVAQDPNFRLEFTPTETIEEAKQLEQTRINMTSNDLLMNMSLDTENIGAGIWKNPELRKQIAQSRIGNTNNQNRVWTPQDRKEASDRMKGNTYLLGHKHSDETRAKMVEAARHKPSRSSESYKRSRETSAQQGESLTKYRVLVGGVEYKNTRHAAESLGVALNTVDKRCQSSNFSEYKKVPKQQ